MYPVGIPLLYAYILWKNRDSLNPRVLAGGNADEDVSPGPAFSPWTKKDYYLDKESMAELHELLRKRKENPDLVPSMFLWKDFGERPSKAWVLDSLLKAEQTLWFSNNSARNVSSDPLQSYDTLNGVRRCPRLKSMETGGRD